MSKKHSADFKEMVLKKVYERKEKSLQQIAEEVNMSFGSLKVGYSRQNTTACRRIACREKTRRLDTLSALTRLAAKSWS